MSQRVTFGELVNLAIGTPELGNVNFNALHFLLHSMLQHFNLQDAQKEVTAEELDFIKPPPRSSIPRSPSQTDTSLRRTSSIFHQMHERIISIEKQLLFLNDTPTTTDLLSRTEAGTFAQPAQDMWQLMQLKKKMEINEEGMTKAMNTLQDLLSNICALKVSTENFKQELGNMKGTFEKLDIDKMLQQLGQMDGQAKVIQELQQQLSSMKEKTSSMPVLSDLVQWGTLCERLQGKSFPAMEKEAADRLSKEILASLGQLPEQHKGLAARVTSLEEKLKCRAEKPKPSEIVGDDGMETTSLTSLTERVNSLESCDLQRKESLKGILDEIPKLKEQYEALERAVEKVKRNSTNIQNIQNMLEQLDITKADKAFIREEMNVKADKSALEAKVNHVELSSTTAQLSEMMQDLLQKMSLQDKDWQRALEKLFADMDSKLDRMALDPLSKQLEEVWHFIKKFLSEGPRFDADSAAGFKKQLFERVKCLSCDRPVTMMTGPHLITVRKATLRPRPASANGYEYLAWKQKKDPETNEDSSNQPPQTCWQCQAHHQVCTIKRMSKSRDFATQYPYGDPTVLTYDNAEVDILGVNGVLYKGRVNAQVAERTLAVQKEFLGVKSPRPPSGLRMERVRSAIADFNYMSPYASSTVRGTRSAMGTQRQPLSPALETMDRVVHGNTSLSHHSFHNNGGVTGM